MSKKKKISRKEVMQELEMEAKAPESKHAIALGKIQACKEECGDNCEAAKYIAGMMVKASIEERRVLHEACDALLKHKPEVAEFHLTELIKRKG
jgi:cation transport ATPase